MTKKTFFFYGAGMMVGAGIGFATHNLAIGVGLGVAMGFAFARNYRRKTRG
jgi:positive regulator of sigma E activity